MDLLPGRLRSGSHTISPTAHYTAAVWASHGLGDARLATPEGRLLHRAGRLAVAPVEALGGPTLEHFLLARHRIIDHLLEAEIAAGRVSQVVELACGLSPRGHELVGRHPGRISYVEVDLPGMAARKQAALERMGPLAPGHRVMAADVMSGAELSRVFASLDGDAGVAVVTEGLLNYFPTDAVRGLWRRVAGELAGFRHGVYLSDLHLRASATWLDRTFAAGLGLFVRGRVHLHFAGEDAAAQALREDGFAAARLHAPREYADRLPGMRAAGADRVRVLEARTGEPPPTRPARRTASERPLS